MINVKKLMIIILIVFAIVVALYPILAELEISILKSNNPNAKTIVNYIVQIVSLIIAIYMLKKFNYLNYVKLSLKTILELIVYILSLLLLTIILVNIFHLKYYLIWNTSESYATLIFQNFYFLFVGLGEEFLFRVILYYKILDTIILKNKKLRMIIAVIITSFLFTMAHIPMLSIGNIQIFSTLNIFMWGIFSSYLYLRTKNIYVAAIAHFFTDAGIIIDYTEIYYGILSTFINIITSVIIIEIYNICKYFYNKKIYGIENFNLK
ncbi:CAAX protease [Thermoanaerobacterium thermosaccharolyticum]|uniref:CPBP family intramembrane glutamic endopeptidase n=1 Tax=Thermoanaerobacterium thermosaccharolyticum TaxID=1517 RepID=UPI000C086FD0|nr:CPBP family intramembrane glutamic endopeptidase [Thermoanaerobacterium thermosaccharolyticum]PHO06852.1 CAAX protease [Thermoanaerobacterium thermosaccharolyticum]